MINKLYLRTIKEVSRVLCLIMLVVFICLQIPTETLMAKENRQDRDSISTEPKNTPSDITKLLDITDEKILKEVYGVRSGKYLYYIEVNPENISKSSVVKERDGNKTVIVTDVRNFYSHRRRRLHPLLESQRNTHRRRRRVHRQGCSKSRPDRRGKDGNRDGA